MASDDKWPIIGPPRSRESTESLTFPQPGTSYESIEPQASSQPRTSCGSRESQASVQTETQEIKVYKRRWWVLAVFVLTSCTQSMAWNTWGPITDSAEAVFGWSDSMIGLLVNLGNISFIIFVMPMSWINDVKGLKTSMMISTTCLVIATGLRCITLDPTPMTWFAALNSVSNGISGSVAFAAPALMSATWFPARWRTIATSIGTFFVFMGVGMSFILGPQVVHSPNYEYFNETTNGSSHFEVLESSTLHSIKAYKNVTNMHQLKSDIKHLLFIHLGLAAFCFLCVLVYFPAKPPHPPSKSESLEHTEYRKGVKQLTRKRPVWLVVIANSLPIGVSGVWGPVLGVNMKPVGVSQDDAGWMGFWMTFGGCTSGVLLASFNDKFKRRMKLFLILLLLGGTVSSLWFTLLCSKYISFNLASLYAASVLAGIFINATTPLFFELACEAAYPVKEGLTGGFLTFFQNLVGILFLSLLYIETIGKSWMNWALVASCALALPLVCMFPEKYNRTKIDERLPDNIDQDVTIDVKANKPADHSTNADERNQSVPNKPVNSQYPSLIYDRTSSTQPPTAADKPSQIMKGYSPYEI